MKKKEYNIPVMKFDSEKIKENSDEIKRIIDEMGQIVDEMEREKNIISRILNFFNHGKTKNMNGDYKIDYPGYFNKTKFKAKHTTIKPTKKEAKYHIEDINNKGNMFKFV